jgi:hypothetical protein
MSQIRNTAKKAVEFSPIDGMFSHLDARSQRARETWGPTLERTVAIIMVITN